MLLSVEVGVLLLAYLTVLGILTNKKKLPSGIVWAVYSGGGRGCKPIN